MTRDITPLVFFIITIIPLFWMSAKGVEAGTFYFLLALLFPALIFLITFFLGAKSKEVFIRLPIKEKTSQGVQLFFLGISTVLILHFIGFVTSKVMSPFFLFSQKMYQSYVIGASRFYEFFIIGWTAAVVEEAIFNLSFMAAGMLVAYWIRKSWGLDFGKIGNHTFHVAIGALFSIIPFTIFHSFNPVYTTRMFIIAAIFRTIVTFLTWFIFDINWGVGVHMANNTLTLSSSVLIGAFTSPYGLVILLLFGTIFYFAIRHWREFDTTFGFGDIW